MLGKKKRSIKKEKFGNYGRSTSASDREEERGPTKGIDSTELRELAVENGRLYEQQSILRRRQHEQ